MAVASDGGNLAAPTSGGGANVLHTSPERRGYAFTSGAPSVAASDGSRLELRADNDDAASYELIVIDGGREFTGGARCSHGWQRMKGA